MSEWQVASGRVGEGWETIHCPFSNIRFLLLSILLALFVAGRAHAHGGGTPQLLNRPAGPYLLSIWTQPDPPRVGEALHVTVAVSEPEDEAGMPVAGPPVLGADVALRFSRDGAGTPLTAVATHDNAANRTFYEADLTLPETGTWRADVQIDGPLGAAAAVFDVEIVAPPLVSPLWLAVGGTAVFVVAGLFWRSRGEREG